MKSDETSEIKLKEYKKQYKEWKSEIEKSHNCSENCFCKPIKIHLDILKALIENAERMQNKNHLVANSGQQAFF